MGWKYTTVRRAALSALSTDWPQTVLTDEQVDGEPSARNQRYANGENWSTGDLVSAGPFRGEIQLAASAGLMAASANATAATFTLPFGGMVCLWHDDDINPKPSWLSDWDDIGYNVLRSNKQLSSLVKTYRPGETVTLQGNGGTSADAMYIPQIMTTYARPLAVPGSGTITLDSSTGTVDETETIQIFVSRVGGTAGMASAPVTLGSGSAFADLQTASVSWQDGDAEDKIISVSAGSVTQNEMVRVLVSASTLQAYNLNVINVGGVVSGTTYIIDFNSPSSGDGTTADPFNTWDHLNNAVSPTDGHLIYRTKGTAEGLLCSPPRGTSASAQVIIQTSATTVLQGVVGAPPNYALSLQSADWVQIMASGDAPLIIDGEVLTATRAQAATSASGKDHLNGGFRFLAEIRDSHDVTIRHLHTRDSWGWAGIPVTGASTDRIVFTSCSTGHHGLPGARGAVAFGDFGDKIALSAEGTVLFKHCYFGPGGHNGILASTGRVIIYRSVFDGDYSVLGGDKGCRGGVFRRELQNSYLDQCILRHNGSTDDFRTTLFKLEGEDNVFRFSLFQVATETAAMKSDMRSGTKKQKNNRIVHNSFWNIRDGMVAVRHFSVSAGDDFGLYEVVNNVINVYGSTSAPIPGDVYLRQLGPLQGRTWDQNLRIRGNIFSTNAEIVTVGGEGTDDLAFYEANYPHFASDNLERIGIYASPSETTANAWADAWASASTDFALTSAFAAGVPLTSAQATTDATVITVADARYWRGRVTFSSIGPDPFFADGQSAEVLSVDYANNKLVLDTSVTLTSGANCYYFSSADPRGIPWASLQ